MKKICVVNRDPNKIRFVVNKLTTLGCNEHFQAYEVQDVANHVPFLFTQSELTFYYLPLHLVNLFDVQIPGVKFIVPRYEATEH